MTTTAPRRRLRAARIVAAALAVIVIGGSIGLGYLRFPPSSYGAMDATDRAAFDDLSTQFEAFRAHAGDLWDVEYRYDTRPLILVRAPDATDARIPGYQYAYVVNGGDAARGLLGATPVDFPDAMGLDDVVVTKVLGSATLATSAPINFTDVDLGDATVLAFRFNADRMDHPEVGLEFSYFSMHEAFHIDKQADWSFDRRDPDRPWEAVRSPEEFDTLRVEAQILDAVDAARPAQTSEEEYRRLARDLVAVRLARIEQSPNVAGQENVEAIEGTARYLEARYADLTHSAGRAEPLPERFLAEEIDIARQDPAEWQQYLEYRLYYETGRRVCALLDQLAPGWKTLIEPPPVGEELTPFDILERTVGPIEELTLDQVRDIGSSYGS